MANEARIQIGLTIKKGNLNYVLPSTAYTATITTDDPKGPVPGALTVTTAGVDVDFSELVTPGLCKITNLDDTNFVSYGVYDGANFHYLGEMLPGETYVFRISRYLGGTDPGTSGDNTFRLQANTASCIVQVEAFEA